MAEQLNPVPEVAPKADQSREYEPNEQDLALVTEVNDKFARWRQDRQPYEQQWFINAAFLRGNQYVLWNESRNTLEKRPTPPHRIRLTVNRILPKIRARIAKFCKNRWTPAVIPASTDREDFLNARATQKVLEYIGRKQNFELKYKEALLWSQTTGKGFWWFYWDPSTTARITQTNPLTGQSETVEAPLGDVAIDVGSPFEVFVSDPGKMHIGDQPEIMRAKWRDVEDLKVRYKDKAAYIKADGSDSEAFQYERQIANLSSKNQRGLPGSAAGGEDTKTNGGKVLVKELFTKPCGKYPKGRYVVIAGQILLKKTDELPYGFGDYANPYPVVEFNDTETAGQYWPTTHIEQMIGLQQEYNNLRSGLQEHIRLMKHPKIFIPEQFRISKESWTSEAGEVIRYVAMPGIAPPTPWTPPPISSDTWRLLDTMKGEFDDVTNIYPAMQGGVGQASSGFQTNLLQEASDSVHAPDIRQHEMSLEDAHFKIRRIVAIGWDVPRLVAVTGRSYEAEVFEFSNDQIDENADIVIQSGSALSNSPAVRSQQVFELFNSGMMGDPNDPEVKRQALSLLNLNTMDSYQEVTHRDESLARLENLEIQRGVEVEFPKPWENHNIHWTFHTDQLKSPEIRQWPQERVTALIAHVVMHAKYVNPQNAVSIAQEFGLNDLIPMIMPPQPPPAPGAPPAPQGAAPPPQEAPPPAPEQAAPPPAEQPPMPMDPSMMQSDVPAPPQAV